MQSYQVQAYKERTASRTASWGNLLWSFWGIRHSGGSLKCLYANACSMRNKQEDLQKTVCSYCAVCPQGSQRCSGIAHSWSAATDGSGLFRQDRLGRQREGGSLWMSEHWWCIGLCLRTGQEPVKNLGVEQINMNHAVVGVCYRLLGQEEQVDKASVRQLKGVSCSHALVLTGNLNNQVGSVWIWGEQASGRSGN